MQKLIAPIACFLSVCTSLVHNNRNELSQFQRYLELTKYLDEKTLFSEWINCQNLLSQNYGRNWRCAVHQTERIREMNGSFFWERKPDKDNFIAVDCQYTLTSDIFMIEGKLGFNILQHDCNFNGILGGSSFEITAYYSNIIVSCYSVDHFNSSYTVLCPFRKNGDIPRRHLQGVYFPDVHTSGVAVDVNEISNGSFCAHFSILLDYEHFDAYSETKSNSPPLRHILATNVKKCSMSDGMYSSDKNQKYWSRTLDSSGHLGYYVWNSRNTNDGSFPSATSIEDCFAEKEGIHFITDAQLHLLAEYIKSVYQGAAQKSTMGDIFSRVSNEERLFVLDALDLFGIKAFQQTCGKPQEHLIVLEMGAWDLRHTPLRNLLRNPQHLPRFFDQLREVLKKPECNNLEIVWVDTAPHPVCLRDDANCVLEDDNGWANNYAIAAMNQVKRIYFYPPSDSHQFYHFSI